MVKEEDNSLEWLLAQGLSLEQLEESFPISLPCLSDLEFQLENIEVMKKYIDMKELSKVVLGNWREFTIETILAYLDAELDVKLLVEKWLAEPRHVEGLDDIDDLFHDVFYVLHEGGVSSEDIEGILDAEMTYKFRDTWDSLFESLSHDFHYWDDIGVEPRKYLQEYLVHNNELLDYLPGDTKEIMLRYLLENVDMKTLIDFDADYSFEYFIKNGVGAEEIGEKFAEATNYVLDWDECESAVFLMENGANLDLKRVLEAIGRAASEYLDEDFLSRLVVIGATMSDFKDIGIDVDVED